RSVVHVAAGNTAFQRARRSVSRSHSPTSSTSSRSAYGGRHSSEIWPRPTTATRTGRSPIGRGVGIEGVWPRSTTRHEDQSDERERESDVLRSAHPLAEHQPREEHG